MKSPPLNNVHKSLDWWWSFRLFSSHLFSRWCSFEHYSLVWSLIFLRTRRSRQNSIQFETRALSVRFFVFLVSFSFSFSFLPCEWWMSAVVLFFFLRLLIHIDRAGKLKMICQICTQYDLFAVFTVFSFLLLSSLWPQWSSIFKHLLSFPCK